MFATTLWSQQQLRTIKAHLEERGVSYRVASGSLVVERDVATVTERVIRDATK